MAVGLERAHPECVGQGKGLAVVGLGALNLYGMTLHRDFPQEPEGVHLVTTVFEGTGEHQGTHRKLLSVLSTAGQEIRCTQMRQRGRIVRLGGILLHGLLQQRQRFGKAPG